MLNGKFYTGLPPKMIDRRNNSNTNRMESHLFWPDDTKTDSAIETRVKRRTSFQSDQSQKPISHQQTSLGGENNDVDTKQMFRREFAKSSIQFNDNVIDERDSNYQHPRRPLLKTMKTIRNDITPKPTAMKLQLPENVVNEGYTSTKKKQAFTSKIQFYDYIDEDLNNRNNARKPKITDRNDKKEVERNSKNSPKLQIKHNVRTMSLNDLRKNDFPRDQHTAEQDAEDHRNSRNATQQRNTKISVKAERKYEPDFEEEYISGNRDSKRATGNPVRNEEDYVARSCGTQRDARRNENVRIVSPTKIIEYVDEVEAPEYKIERYHSSFDENNSSHNSDGRIDHSTPKKILKNNAKMKTTNSDYNDEYRGDDFNNEINYIENNMRNVHVRRTSPKKHVTYEDDFERPLAKYSNNNKVNNDAHNVIPSRSSRITTTSTYRSRAKSPNPNTRTGNNTKRSQTHHTNMSDLEYVSGGSVADEYQYMETGSGSTIKSVNNSNNQKLNNLKSSQASTRKITPKITAIDSSVAADSLPSTSSKKVAQNHLRSSLCFHGGEIVANNGGSVGASSSSSPSETPTSTRLQQQQQRRYARSSATQRVSVGLPD